jgi:amino acid adenylation domain-containing protein
VASVGNEEGRTQILIGERGAGPLVGATRPIAEASVLALIHRVSLAHPAAVALEHRGREQTFAELMQRVADLAAALADAGVRRGDCVAVWADRTPAVIATALAAMALGAAYVPVDPTNPAARTQSILLGSGATVLAHDGGTVALPTSGTRLAQVDVGALPRGTRGLPELPAREEIAYLIFTSGTTGVPKGVAIEHGSLVNYVEWGAATVGESGLGSPVIGSLGYDLSMTSLWIPLTQGKRVVLTEGILDQQALLRRRAEPFTFIKATPSHYRFLERTGRPSYSALTNLVMFGGEQLEVGLLRTMAERLEGVRLINHYGPTETTIGCCYNELRLDDLPSGTGVPIGRPIWNTRVYVVDESLRPLPPGAVGELVIAGRGVARGYVGAADTGARFIDERELGGPAGRAYRTGDFVERLPSDVLLYVGRRDNQLKVSGHRVEMGELRAKALVVRGVADAAFEVVRKDLEHLEAYVVPTGDIPDDELPASVRLALSASLPPPLVPRRVHVVPEIRTNANGKVDLEATRARLDRTADSSARRAS